LLPPAESLTHFACDHRMPLALLAGAPVVSATNSVIGVAFVKVHQPVAVDPRTVREAKSTGPR
jgi:hypothetical protein